MGSLKKNPYIIPITLGVAGVVGLGLEAIFLNPISSELAVNSPKHERPFIEGIIEGERAPDNKYELRVTYDENGNNKSITFRPTNEFEIDYLDSLYNSGDKIRIERKDIIGEGCGCNIYYRLKGPLSISLVQ